VGANRWRSRATLIVAAALLLASPHPLLADGFADHLARVDRALKGPSDASQKARESCLKRRNYAVRLYSMGEVERAERGLKYCMHLLQIPEKAPAPVAREAPVPMAEIQARAAREIERALPLKPDVANGLNIYRTCALCHTPEGWGLQSGLVPQIAGQHRKVIIKQLADFRAGNRESVIMGPYASVESIGGTQAIADVAGYIDTLEMTVEMEKGAGDDLELGAQLYRDNCARCHGAAGEGNNDAFVPRIQAQHYEHLVRQFQSIRDGNRRNANAEMVAQIRSFDDRQTRAVLDYVSRLEPPEEFRAPPGWHNPDFAQTPRPRSPLPEGP
jgi:cytochrome c553